MWCAALAESVFDFDGAGGIVVHGPGSPTHVTQGYEFGGVKDAKSGEQRAQDVQDVYGMRSEVGRRKAKCRRREATGSLWHSKDSLGYYGWQGIFYA
jgi:hypothetical protein